MLKIKQDKIAKVESLMIKALLSTLAAFLLLPLFAFAQTGVAIDLSDNLWESFTNMRNLKAAKSNARGIWAATTGGLLFWDHQQRAYRYFRNTDGLSQNELTALGFDARDRVWLGQASGMIDVYDPAGDFFAQINDFKTLGISEFVARGDSMYIALSIGVSLYRVDRKEVKETYKNLGQRLEIGTAVRTIFLDGEDLWAGTDRGIAKTSLTLPNLLAPESWTNYTTSEGLPSNVVLGFTKWQGQIIVALSSGIAQFDGTRWISLNGDLADPSVRQITVTRDAGGSEVLLAATSSGLFTSTTPGSWQRYGTSVASVTGVVVDPDRKPWLATSNAGLYESAGANQEWLWHEPDGPGSNSITSLALDQQGNLWCTSGFSDLNVAFTVFDGERWHTFSAKDHPAIWNDSRKVIVLQNGERWIGTWGGGITIVRGELGNLEFQRIDRTNNILSSAVLSDPNYVCVPDMKQDDAGNVWVCNYTAVNSNVIAVHTPAEEWRYFSTSDGLQSGVVVALEIEKTTTADRIWVGTDNAGVSVIDYNGTLDTKNDDDLSGELDEDDNLLSVDVNALAQDRDGFIWLGTELGLNYWFAGTVGSRFGLISDNVQVIKVDPRNNKWIGTNAGISVLSGDDNFSLTAITVENSRLVSKSITDLAFNPDNGDVWIATTNGISRLRTPFTAPKADLKFLTGYPNPFRLGEAGGRFVISNLAENSAVKIFSASGELIRTFTREQIPGAQVIWDGRDSSNQLVPSGVYFFMAYIEETGNSAVGKVAVIRR